MLQAELPYQPIRPPPSRQAEKEHGGFFYSVPFLSYPFKSQKPKGDFNTWHRAKSKKSQALKKKSSS